MTNSITKLLEIASQPIGPLTQFNGGEGIMRSYLNLLEAKNGFYAFESALLVRPGFVNDSKVLDSRKWNEPDLWKSSYESLRPMAFFFAEDAFGNQFGIGSESVTRFDAETGEIEIFASSIEDWADKLLADYQLHTGYSIISEWQKINGPLEMGGRLIFKQPLVLGGKIEINNLIYWNDVKAMRARGALAEQLKDVEDGGQVYFNYTD